MQVDKEAVLKQHFWILLSLVALLPLICLIVLWTAASDTIDTKKKEVVSIEDQLKKITPNAAHNQKWLDDLGERGTQVKGQKDKIWAVAWGAQAGMIGFPESLAEAKDINEKLSFGDDLSENFRTNYARGETPYRPQYEENLEIVDPVKSPTEGKVQYKSSPESVVPPIFGGKFEKRPPDSVELWLIQEDLAVQRELLRIIKDTNDMIATFRKVPGAPKVDKSKGEIDRQYFTNPNFKLDLTLLEKKGKKVFHCVLTNISKRRQSLGIGFLVAVKGMDTQSIVAEGEPLAPKSSVVVKEKDGDQETEDLKVGTQGGILQGEVLEGVMQVFDWRTVPIKRIDIVRSGVNSHRTQGALVPPAFDKAATEAAEAAKQALQPAGDMSGGGGNSGAMNPSDPAAMQARMSQAMQGMGNKSLGFSGGKSDQTKNGIEKNRYMSSSKQVRRIPVALAVVMDQAYVDDFLTVVANSKLRIQTTQVYWQRFHDDIKPTYPEEPKPGEAKPGETAPPKTATAPGGGKMGIKGGGMMAGEGVGNRAGPGGLNSGARTPPGSGAMQQPNMAQMQQQMAQMQQQMRQRMMGGGGGKFGGGMAGGDMGTGRMQGRFTSPSPYTSGASAAAPDVEPEEESNLVEVAFYGIASLYERFPPPNKKEGADLAQSGQQN
jgi:hypothetical protein